MNFYKRELKNKVRDLQNYVKSFSSILSNGKEFKLMSSPTIYVMDTPLHGNLGDQAIIFAEREFLKEKYPDYEVVEIPTADVIPKIRVIKRQLKKDDIIYLHGGGNFGIEYFNAERARRYVIKLVKNNPIIMFPQTIDFGKTKWGNYQFHKTVKIYSKAKNLKLHAREEKSYKIISENFKNDVYLTPDIVLFLKEIKFKNSKIRKGIKLFIRNDMESILNERVLEDIVDTCKGMSDSVILTDTVIPRNVPLELRRDVLFAKWAEFAESELVVTDRLHGMVFAAITNTPCIVISNYNHKVKGTNKWIKNLRNIIYVDSIEDVVDEISKYYEKKSVSFNDLQLNKKYEDLVYRRK